MRARGDADRNRNEVKLELSDHHDRRLAVRGFDP
jgi:hypothetical protein